MKNDAAAKITKTELLMCLGLADDDTPASIVRVLVERVQATIGDPEDVPSQDELNDVRAMLHVALRFAREIESGDTAVSKKSAGDTVAKKSVEARA